MPHHIAMELLLTGRWMDAAEAHRWGLVNEVHPAAELVERALAVAAQLAAGPPLVFAAIKEVQREGRLLGFAEAMRRVGAGEFPTVATLYASEDHAGRCPGVRREAAPAVEGTLNVGHGHGHGHGCAADHHRGEYTERQRADLDLVLAFNHRLAQAVDDCVDITDTIAALDPDPLRYMWVDEGDGQIPAQLAKAARRAGRRAPAGRADPRRRPAAPGQPQRGPSQRRRARRDHAGRLAGVAGGPRRPAASPS